MRVGILIFAFALSLAAACGPGDAPESIRPTGGRPPPSSGSSAGSGGAAGGRDAGIVAGTCGNPAVRAFANTLAPTDRPDVGYAMIFPGMTLVTIVCVSVVPAFL